MVFGVKIKPSLPISFYIYASRHATCAHARSSSTIAVWLARLVASLTVSLGIFFNFYFRRVKSSFIYSDITIIATFSTSLLQFWETVGCARGIVRSSRLSLHCLCATHRLTLTLVQCGSCAPSHFLIPVRASFICGVLWSRTRVFFVKNSRISRKWPQQRSKWTEV